MLKKKHTHTQKQTTTKTRAYHRVSDTELAFSTFDLYSQHVQTLLSFSVLCVQALTLVPCLPWVLSRIPIPEQWGSQALDLSWAPTPASAFWTLRLTQLRHQYSTASISWVPLCKTRMSQMQWNWYNTDKEVVGREGFPCSSVGKESACNAGDLCSIPGSGRSPGEGNGSSLQYSCLENPMDRGAW